VPDFLLHNAVKLDEIIHQVRHDLMRGVQVNQGVAVLVFFLFNDVELNRYAAVVSCLGCGFYRVLFPTT
jgi:hypothetical protein